MPYPLNANPAALNGRAVLIKRTRKVKSVNATRTWINLGAPGSIGVRNAFAGRQDLITRGGRRTVVAPGGGGSTTPAPVVQTVGQLWPPARR